jgi:hypothetical protein
MAATSSYFGPRRGRKVQQEGQSVVLWDTGDRTVLQPSENGQLTTPALSRKATAQLAVAVSSLNLFPKTLVVTDEATVRVGKQKSLAFALAMPVAAIAILSWYMLTPQLQSFTTYNPTYADYTHAQQYNPTCPCSNPNLVFGDVGTFNPPAVSNPELNFCSSVYGIMTYCTDMPNLNASSCFKTNGGALLLGSFMQPMYSICNYLAVGLGDVAANILSAPLGGTLMTPFAFNQSTRQQALDEIEKLSLLATSIRISLNANSWAGLTASFLDPSFESISQNPPNCSCLRSALSANSSPAAVLLGTGLCYFHIAFDVRPPNTTDLDRWTCVGSDNLIYFPMELLRTPALYILLGLNETESANLTSFVTAPGSDTFLQVMVDTHASLYSGNLATAGIATTLLTYDHPSYFLACAPSECSYSYKAVPPFVTGFTLAIGA